MAKEAGIDMMPCRLLEENGRAHVMTKRFDRDGDKKHHVQSLCAMSHLDYKQRATHSYGQLFLTISQLGLGDDALQQAFLRMAFNVMARNCDDHTKNFAFILRDTRVWSLSPAYDVTHAHNPKGEWTAQHLMSVNGVFDDISRIDLIRVGERFGVPDLHGALKRVQQVVQDWQSFAGKAGVGTKEAKRVSSDFQLL
jgi:serine/threonine-protein kinase HipA